MALHTSRGTCPAICMPSGTLQMVNAARSQLTCSWRAARLPRKSCVNVTAAKLVPLDSKLLAYNSRDQLSAALEEGFGLSMRLCGLSQRNHDMQSFINFAAISGECLVREQLISEKRLPASARRGSTIRSAADLQPFFISDADTQDMVDSWCDELLAEVWTRCNCSGSSAPPSTSSSCDTTSGWPQTAIQPG